MYIHIYIYIYISIYSFFGICYIKPFGVLCQHELYYSVVYMYIMLFGILY